MPETGECVGRSDRDAIQCDGCGIVMFDNEQTRREMDLHESECDGSNDPHERFEAGDRVEYSEFGRERLGVDPREGTIAGFGSEKHHNEHCVRVRWDGLKTPKRYAQSFVRQVGGE